MTKQSFSSIRISDDIQALMDSSEPVTAFNLVGLSSLSNAQLVSKNYVYWVDGVMGTFACYLAGLKISRKPGRDLLTGLLKYIRTTVPNRPVVLIGADYITEQINELLGREVVQLDLPWVTSIEVAQKIRFDNLTPDHIVILAVGSPKQEWVAASIYKTTGAKCFCFGGAVNMLEGRESVAPFWVQKVGIEWIFRIISDPKPRVQRLITSLPHGFLNLRHYKSITRLF